MTHSSQLSLQSPLLARLAAWAKDRFPLANAVLFLVLYLAGLTLGRSLVTDGPIVMGIDDFLGFIAVWSFFLMIRVFDEHKDYEQDCLNHPDRVLQRGLVTLNHLKVLGAASITLQAVISVYLAGGWGLIPLFWLVTFGWTLLMAVEFFCGEWLEKRIVLYAFSHMIVMPMALVWMAQMGAGAHPLPWTVGVVAALSFFSGASFEVIRKLKAPEDERETVDSYTKALGTHRAPVVAMGLMLVTTVFSILFLSVVFGQEVPAHWLGLVSLAMLPAAWSLFQFRRNPSAAHAKMSEALVGLGSLVNYVVLISAIVVEHGVRWM